MQTIPLHGRRAAGRVALIDDADYDVINQYSWFLWEQKREGGRGRGPYAHASIGHGRGNRHYASMHKMITGYDLTDHINHDGLDNRRANLREATRTQNARNMRPYVGSSSQYKGVSWDRQYSVWMAQIHRGDGSRVYLGRFTDETDAARAFDAAALEMHGQFAYLNFPA